MPNFINALGNNLSGATGTGSFVGSNSPTLVTPIIDTATISGTIILTKNDFTPQITMPQNLGSADLIISGSASTTDTVNGGDLLLTGGSVTANNATSGNVIIAAGDTQGSGNTTGNVILSGKNITLGAANDGAFNVFGNQIIINSLTVATSSDQVMPIVIDTFSQVYKIAANYAISNYQTITSNTGLQTGTGYTLNQVSGTLSLTIPSNPLIGEIIEINGVGGSGWTIPSDSGQTFIQGSSNSTSSISSTVATSSIGLRCIAVGSGTSVWNIIYATTEITFA